MTAPCHHELVEILGPADLDSLTSDWDSLVQHSYDNRVFMSPLWTRTWLRHARDVTVRVIVERDESGRLAGVLPLQIVRSGGELVLSLLGDPQVTDYMDGAANKDTAPSIMRSLWQTAFAHVSWDRIELRHVPSTSPLLAALQEVCISRRLDPVVHEDEVCPVAILCNTWDGYLEMLTKKQRHEIRRKIRRCEEGADVVWSTAGTLRDLESDLPVFFDLLEASARGKAGFMTENMRRFFGDIARVMMDAGILRLSMLRRNGAPIAATMAFLHRGRYLLYNSGYDPGESHHSPGIVAVAHAMQDAIREKAVVFDFLSGAEPYKYQFGAQDTYTCAVGVRRGP